MSCAVSERFVSRTALDFGNYAELHQDGRELIQGWFKQAAEPSEDKFEPFIYLWIAFNAGRPV